MPATTPSTIRRVRAPSVPSISPKRSEFINAIGVTGLAVTKLDGTAKGGVVFALAREFGIPIRYAGIGERAEDLRVFDPHAFVDALLPASLAG